MKGLSFIEYLKQENIPVYLIDWGEPRTQDRFATIEDHILHWMDWAIKKSCEHAKVEKIDLFGQCIGGTFAAIYTSLRPERVKSIIALTAPINFHDKGLLSFWANNQIKPRAHGDSVGKYLSRIFKRIFSYAKAT